MFLVENNSKNEESYSLYNEDKKLTESIFKSYGMCEYFNEFGFTVVSMFGKYSCAVINKAGDIIIETDSMMDNIYLQGVVCSSGRSYVNLLTGNVICEKGYDSMNTDEFLFIKVETNCIYQISKKTGDFIVHGEVKKVEEPKVVNTQSIIVKKNTEPSPKIQGRNELCNCGSNKKFKNCCINGK